jgi:hypothetical protein
MYATGVVINSRVKTLKMRSYRTFNIVTPLVLFTAVFIIFNYVI